MKTVLVAGAFNVLHPGHLRLLSFAKQCGDRLVVAVYSDRFAGVSAHLPENLRLGGVQSISWVDEAFVADESVDILIDRMRPDIVVKGREHETRFNAEQEVLNRYGGQLIFSSGEAMFSSRDLIRREFDLLSAPTINLPYDYLARHRIASTRLRDIVKSFSDLVICVVGDVIVDQYITCEPLGMSQEEPTIVVTPLDSTRFLGGAGIVSAHAASLGADVRFVSFTGRDPSREFVLERLASAGVVARLLVDENRPTTLKQRFRSRGKSLLRVNILHQGPMSIELQQKFLLDVERVIEGVDLLVFSDFNYGCLPQPLVDKIQGLARRHGVLLAADSQSSSQLGDLSRFKGMDLITPTEREARVSTRNSEDGLVILAEQLRRQADARNVLLKLGGEGVLIHEGHGDGASWANDKLPAFNSAPKDVAGAGDSLLIASAMALAAGASIWEAACLGSLAAAVQVGRLGNTPLRVDELTNELG